MRENRDSIHGKGIHIMPAALMTLTVLSGRQKTPDEAVVMGKGGGQLGEKRQDAEISVSEILPWHNRRIERITEREAPPVRITADADAHLPQTGSFHSAKVRSLYDASSSFA